jgi:phosphohistidine phosphatase
MKTLLLMRHAKSSWKDASLSDFQRPLKKRGEKDMLRIAQVLKEEDLIPEFVLSSPAVRARETIEILAKELGIEEELVEFVDDFYGAEIEDFFDVLADLPDSYKKVMVVGHNPSLEAFLQTLTGEIDSLPTASVALIKLGIQSWEDIDEDEQIGQLREIWRPREL